MPPSFNLGPDIIIPCNTTHTLTPLVVGGTGNYQYYWNTNSSDSTDPSISVSEGFYKLVVDDGTGCLSEDSVNITESLPPVTIVSGGGDICNDGTVTNINFNFDGTEFPWNLTYSDGISIFNQNGIYSPNFSLNTNTSGTYYSVVSSDNNNCISLLLDTVTVNKYDLPIAIISPIQTTIYEGESIILSTDIFQTYKWYNSLDSLYSLNSEISVTQAGQFYVIVTDKNNCIDTSNIAIVNTVPLTEIYIPNTFTPNGDYHNELFEIYGINIRNFKMIITNRWGELIFTTYNINKFWDGKYNGLIVPEGDYMYSIELLGEDQEKFIKQGIINVIY